jgi:hypothetical protein
LGAASATPAHRAATTRTISARGISGERNQRLDRAEHRLRPEHAREGPERRVEVLHRGDVVAAGDGDPVFRPLELGLQREEVRVRLELRIVFADREQAPESARERVLRILQLLDLFRVGQVIGVEMNRGRLGARLGDLNKDVLFLLGEALNGCDQIGNEIGAALILVLNLGPRRIGGFLLGRNDIVTARGNRNGDQRQSGKRSQPIKKAHCQPLRDETPLPRGSEPNHKAPNDIKPLAMTSA